MRSLIYWLFLASGAAGLIYEVVWMRMLMRILGATVLAYTIVLSAFMLGLAVGGWRFGRRIDRRGNPLLVYAALEAGIGLWALLLPHLMDPALSVFAGAARELTSAPLIVNAIRALLAFAALLVPTTLMGGTLPVLSKFVVQRSEDLGHKVGQLYAINTLGAILGAGASGFALIGKIGEIRTTLVAVALNLTAAGVAVLVKRAIADELARPEPSAVQTGVPEDRPVSRRLDWLLLLVVAVTGFTVLAYEVLWTRTAVLIVHNTTYSFSLMLLAFLTGIAAGSAIMAALLRAWNPSWPVRWRLLGGLQILIGLVALGSLAGTVPVVRLVVPVWARLGGHLADWVSAPVPVIFLLLAPLTLVSGASFPVAASLYARDLAAVGRRVGAVYLWNTIGAAAGSAAAGFLLLPRLGIARSFLVCVGVNVVAGLLALLSLGSAGQASGLPWRRRAQLCATGLGVAGLVAVFLALAASSTRSLDIPRTLLRKRLERPHQRNIFYKEDINGIVSVWINPLEQDPWINNKRLYIDGQAMASAYRYGMIYERLQAHYPLMLHPDPKDVLVICLGTGTTLGSVGQYPVERIDCVELSPAVVEAGVCFKKETHNILGDPRVTVHTNDGRNYLLATEKAYDVITAEPMHPHLAGTVNLYTREYFELVKARLRRGGICSHWIPVHMMRPDEVKVAIQAFRSVFPHNLLFLETADLIIVGSDEPLKVEVGRWRRLLDDPRISVDLDEVGLSSVPQLLATYMMDDAGLQPYAGGERPVEDDLPTLEFFGSFAATASGQPKNIREIVARRDPLSRLQTHLKGALSTVEAGALARLYPVENTYLLAYADYVSGDLPRARSGFERVLAAAPDDKRAEIALNATTKSMSARGRQPGFGGGSF